MVLLKKSKSRKHRKERGARITRRNKQRGGQGSPPGGAPPNGLRIALPPRFVRNNSGAQAPRAQRR